MLLLPVVVGPCTWSSISHVVLKHRRGVVVHVVGITVVIEHCGS
jgi:hypothetical protein